MSRTVDLVVDGAGAAARAAAIDALRRGHGVLVVLRSADRAVARRLRRCLCKGANVDVTRLTVMTHAAVVCVDGVDGVEAVVVRYARTGRVCAVNTSAFVGRGAVQPSAALSGERSEHSVMLQRFR